MQSPTGHTILSLLPIGSVASIKLRENTPQEYTDCFATLYISYVRTTLLTDIQVWCQPGFVLDDIAEVLHEVRRILRDLDVDLCRKLLAHTVIARPGGRLTQRGVSFHHQDRTFEIRIGG